MDEVETEVTITRRAAVARVSAMFSGVALVGGNALLSACVSIESRSPSEAVAALFDIPLLDQIADTILPETTTPGAKAAGVGGFIAVMVTDVYSPQEQQIFFSGVTQFRTLVRQSLRTDFGSATDAQRTQLLVELDREQFDYMQSRTQDEPVHYFRMLKELSLLGYFTSEIGYTQAMRYRESPGRFDPSVPYESGDTLWASHS